MKWPTHTAMTRPFKIKFKPKKRPKRKKPDVQMESVENVRAECENKIAKLQVEHARELNRSTAAVRRDAVPKIPPFF
jgi:hypothetical protein